MLSPFWQRTMRGSDGRLPLGMAVAIAALPHRRELYLSGGWTNSAGPGASGWPRFVSEWFSSLELEAAECEGRGFAAHPPAKAATWRVVDIWHADYPPLLQHIFDAPAILFSSGTLTLHDESAVAIVGTRNPAPIARAAVESYVRRLTTQHTRPLLVSGFARGIDGCVHRAGVREGLAGLAVLGSGLMRPGPAANLEVPRLARKAGVPFAFVSEFSPGRPAYASNFPRRNRIIAGLTKTTAVFQAPHGSGALITARFALEEGRDVEVFDHPLLAAPGLNEGGRRLLEEGATAIVLPELEERLVAEPEATLFDVPEPSLEQLEFWQSHNEGRLRSLGDGLFLKRPSRSEPEQPGSGT